MSTYNANRFELVRLGCLCLFCNSRQAEGDPDNFDRNLPVSNPILFSSCGLPATEPPCAWVAERMAEARMREQIELAILVCAEERAVFFP